MKKSLKYIVCITISLAITATVLFLPSFYYKANDQSTKSQISVEAFSINAPKHNLSPQNIYDLINSESAVWIENTPSANTDIITKSTISAINALQYYFDANGAEAFAFNTFINDSNVKLNTFLSTTVSGSVDGTPMSSTLYSMDFFGANFDIATVVIDIDTNIIYEFQIYYSEMTEYKGIEAYASGDYATDEYSSFEKEYNISQRQSLAKYWGISEDKVINIYSNNKSFLFSIFKDFYNSNYLY